MIRALYLLFVLSGAAGLIYESIWTRYLGLFVGHDAYAQIIVLVIFLGGMSVGALAVSRRSERLTQPLYGYVAVEFAVGLIGLFFHEAFQGVISWTYATVYPALAGSWLLPLAKWGIASALILPQSVLLGMTFPLMTAGVLRLARENAGPLARDALLLQQPRRGGGRARRRFLPGLAGRPARHPAHRRHAQPRRGRSDGWRGALQRGMRRSMRERRESKAGERGGSHARPSRFYLPGPATRANAPLDQPRHRRRVVHLRDRLDPDARAGPRQRDSLVRADALGVHPRPRPRRLVDPLPRRPAPEPAPHAGPRPVDDGLPRIGHAAALRPVVRLGGRPPLDVCPQRRRLHRLHDRPIRALSPHHASRHLLRGDDAAAHHPHADRGRRRRARDRRGVRLEHARLDRGCGTRRSRAAAAARPQGHAHHGRRDRHGHRGAAARPRRRAQRDERSPAGAGGRPGHRRAGPGGRPRRAVSTGTCSRAACTERAASCRQASGRSRFYRDGRTATVTRRQDGRAGHPDARHERKARRVARRRPGISACDSGSRPLAARWPTPRPRRCCRSSPWRTCPTRTSAAVIGQGSGMSSHLLLGSPALKRPGDDRDRAAR